MVEGVRGHPLQLELLRCIDKLLVGDALAMDQEQQERHRCMHLLWLP